MEELQVVVMISFLLGVSDRLFCRNSRRSARLVIFFLFSLLLLFHNCHFDWRRWQRKNCLVWLVLIAVAVDFLFLVNCSNCATLRSRYGRKEAWRAFGDFDGMGKEAVTSIEGIDGFTLYLQIAHSTQKALLRGAVKIRQLSIEASNFQLGMFLLEDRLRHWCNWFTKKLEKISDNITLRVVTVCSGSFLISALISGCGSRSCGGGGGSSSTSDKEGAVAGGLAGRGGGVLGQELYFLPTS